MAEQGLKKLKWLAWNPLWLLIAAAWILLVGWAMKSAMSVGTPTSTPEPPAAQAPQSPQP